MGRDPVIGGGSASGRDAVDLEVRRIGTRLAGLGPARVERPGADGVSPAERVRPLLQHLADVAADAEGQPRRPVPRLAPHALSDQLVVLVRDLLAATRDEAVVDDVHDRLVQLRRSL